MIKSLNLVLVNIKLARKFKKLKNRKLSKSKKLSKIGINFKITL